VILEVVCFLKNFILEMMVDNVVISEVDAVMYIVLSKEEKHVLYGK
jgi:hypothetical protein